MRVEEITNDKIHNCTLCQIIYYKFSQINEDITRGTFRKHVELNCLTP
jgi:hypothetical protein